MSKYVFPKPQAYRFECQHVGRDNTNGRRVTGFIRLGELRGAPVEDVKRVCPDCKAASHAPAA